MAWRIGKTDHAAPHVSTGEPTLSSRGDASLPEVRRDFYLEHPEVSALTAEQAEALRRELHIRVHGEDCPNPVSSFLQASFPQYVLDALAQATFVQPTAIQRQSWPIAMQGLDLIGLAETGSGKTLAYLLPALVHVNAQPVLEEGDGPLAIVLAPTRELAVQIHEECVRFGHPCGVSTICIYGGVPKQPQIQGLRKAPEVVIATPGRLTDLLSSRKTELSRCTYVVVDEADRMLDMGFEPQLRGILHQMRADRQTLMFSATWPTSVQELASKFLLPGVMMVEVGGALVEAGKANSLIEQRVIMCDTETKLTKLVALLEEVMDGSKILIFCSSKRRCDQLTKELRIDGWPALTLHGDKPQVAILSHPAHAIPPNAKLSQPHSALSQPPPPPEPNSPRRRPVSS